jgi:hypothetical protein
MVMGLFGLFLLPVLLAWLLTSGRLDWMPRGRVNYGTLIQPAIALEPWLDAAERRQLPHSYGSWALALIQDGAACGTECVDGWDRLWRVHEALQGEKLRVTAAVILEATATPPEAKALVLPLPSRAMQELLQALARHDPAATDATAVKDRLVIIDYQGNIMMLYPAHPDMGGVLNDLKRLLRASKTVS